MRYIPDYASQVVLQIPEDRNAYINVKNVGASGRGDVNFSASVTNIQDSILTLGNVSDGQGGGISEYRDFLKTGTDLLAFIYSPPGAQQDASLTIPTFTQVGVDFSSSEFTNPNLAPLKYIVFGYDVQTGAVPNAREVVEVGSKILNPDFWNLDQYVQLNLSKSSQYVVPVIYRIWGSRVDFLGLIGNNTTGYSTTGSFRDLGLTEIPNWDVDRTMPSFLDGVFSITGADVVLSKIVRGKEKLNIRPTFTGALQNTLQCFSEGVLSKYAAGNTVMFVIDDTQYVENAVVLAANGTIKDVFFPSGTYNTSSLSFESSDSIDYSNITLRGVGESSRIKRLPSQIPNNPGLVSFSGAGNNSRILGVKLDSVVFDGNRGENFSAASPRESETTINVEFSDSITIRNCLVQDNAGQGVRISDSSNISLLNSRVSRTGRAYEQGSEPLVVVNSENLVAQGNILELATSSPLVESTDFSTLNGNIVRRCGDKGFDLQSSFQWNSQGNVAYSDNDSIIRSIDTYNNEYSRATIEVRKGFALDPIYMTVTYGGEPVSIVKNSVKAEIFNLTAQGTRGTKAGSFRVIQTANQLEAGIFSLTLPGTTSQQSSGETIIATGLLNNQFGYVYEVRADILIGGGPRGYRPLSIGAIEINSETYPAVNLVNSSDILSLQIHSPQGLENDRISIRNISPSLTGWDEDASYPVYDIDAETNAIVLDQIAGFTPLNPSVEFSEGRLFIARPNYFVADGNLFVHTF
jgi:parallel beta-helix repeat protein